jgi:hypothetical protein
VDTRATAEQAELRRAAGQLAGRLGPKAVADLDDADRASKLRAAVRDAGWLELRDDDGHWRPLAGGVEAAIVAEALGESAADVAFAGPVLARDLARRAQARDDRATVVALSPSLREVTVLSRSKTSAPICAVDAGDDARVAYALVREGAGYRLAEVALEHTPAAASGADLTRAVRTIPPGAAARNVETQGRLITDDDLLAWTALGLALTSADLVGVMRGVLDVTVAYASDRRQFGVAVGSFQAVQHLLAEARCLLEGSISVAQHAAWAADVLPPGEAVEAGRVAKAYCSRAARTVCETAIQVHGGIGNTWECLAHVYLRRALLSSQWFGDDAAQLRALADARLGAV